MPDGKLKPETSAGFTGTPAVVYTADRAGTKVRDKDPVGARCAEREPSEQDRKQSA